jgi:hypothetical protein
MAKENAFERLQRVLKENNLKLVIMHPDIHKVEGGGLVMDAATIAVSFIDPVKEDEQIRQEKTGKVTK